MKTSELVVVSTFASVAEAQLAQGLLTEASIESVIRSDNAGGMYPALDGATLLVRVDDVKSAMAVLARDE